MFSQVVKLTLEGEAYDSVAWFIYFSPIEVSLMRPHKNAERDEEILLKL